MNFINVMNKNGCIFVIQKDLMDPVALLANGCTLYPSVKDLYKAKCDLLDMESYEVDGCEFAIKGTKTEMFLFDDIDNEVGSLLDVTHLNWLVEMGECEQPEIIEQIVAFYQM